MWGNVLNNGGELLRSAYQHAGKRVQLVEKAFVLGKKIEHGAEAIRRMSIANAGKRAMTKSASRLESNSSRHQVAKPKTNVERHCYRAIKKTPGKQN